MNYNIHYKWGIIMAKAGTAQFTVSNSQFNSQPAYLSTLTFKTTSTFDKIFKIRDTLHSYISPKVEPIFHQKFLHEGNTHFKEKLTFKKFGKSESRALSVRNNADGSLKFEKELEAPGFAFDMVSIFAFARALDYGKLVPGEEIPIFSFVGRDVVKMKVVYAGQEILEKGGNKKYKTLKFEVDIIDEAFESSKKAMELWISDDPNRIPIKIKAKLKIGSAEAELDSYKGIRYPLSSLVIIKPRN